jgi:hypothetical protein
MQAHILQDKDTSYLDDILLHEGRIQALPSEELRKINNTDLRLWCHKNAIYGLPSVELIELIKGEVPEDTSIEVGGGCGVFGRLLNITSTDSCIQAEPAMIAYYELLNQPPVKYGANVLEYEASKAIDVFKPDVVFGSWVTQYVSPLEDVPPGGGSVYGLRENEFFSKIKRYVIYGNTYIHGQKELFKQPGVAVKTIQNPEIMFSRASYPAGNCLYVVEHN